RLVAVRERIPGRDGAPDRALKECGNHVTWKWLAGQKIDRPAEERLRKVAAALGKRRHVGHPCDPLAKVGVLVVAEEKSVFGHQRPTQRAAELMPIVVGRRDVLRREMIARIERAVPEKLVRGSRKLIRS